MRREKEYEVIFWKAVERIIKEKREVYRLIEELESLFELKKETEFLKLVGKLIIVTNNLYTALEGLEILFPEMKEIAGYNEFKSKYEKIMKFIIEGYEAKKVVSLKQFVGILKESYLDMYYLYLTMAFRKEGAYVLQ